MTTLTLSLRGVRVYAGSADRTCVSVNEDVIVRLYDSTLADCRTGIVVSTADPYDPIVRASGSLVSLTRCVVLAGRDERLWMRYVWLRDKWRAIFGWLRRPFQGR